MKILLGIVSAIALLAVGFSAGFPVGKSAGFESGSEWAIVQAEICAREAGLFMPVSMNDGKFHVVIRQRPGIYKKAWELADRYYEQTTNDVKIDAQQGTSEQRDTGSDGIKSAKAAEQEMNDAKQL